MARQCGPEIPSRLLASFSVGKAYQEMTKNVSQAVVESQGDKNVMMGPKKPGIGFMTSTPGGSACTVEFAIFIRLAKVTPEITFQQISRLD